MKTEEILNGILDNVKVQLQQTKNNENSSIQKYIVDDKFSDSIKQYLIEPYENGFWEFSHDWNFSSEFHQEIINQTQILPDLKDFQQNKEKIFTFINEKSFENTKAKRTLSYITSTATFPLSVFNEANNKEPSEIKVPLLDVINLDYEIIKTKFSEAFEIFKNNIHFNDFTPRVKSERPFQLKNSFGYVIKGPKNSKIINFVSTNKEDIESLALFYKNLGIINSASIRRVFAPDENLFKPYFRMLSSIFKNIVTDNGISIKFTEALTYYQENDYQHCISTLGLIAESYLQQIYSTLIRDELPNGLTLGQTLDNLHKRIEEITTPNSNQSRGLETLSLLTNDLSKKNELKDLKPLISEIKKIIEEDRKYFSKKITERNNNNNQKASPFPKKILNNVNELLKWRNAASHNSRIALGSHEADRTIFCLVRLINWWNTTSNEINWNKTKIEIINELVSKSK